MTSLPAGRTILEEQCPVATETVRQTTIWSRLWIGRRRFIVCLVLTAFLGTGIGLGVTYKYRFIAKRWGVVVPGKIYRSGQISKWVLEDKLKVHNIQVVIDLNGLDPEDQHQEYEIALLKRLDIEHFRFPLGGDGTGDIRNYALALKIIDDCCCQGRTVLVHCAAGAQRTGVAIACYRVLVQKHSPETARRELRSYGGNGERNSDLIRYANSHMGELARLLVENGVLDDMPGEIPHFEI